MDLEKLIDILRKYGVSDSDVEQCVNEIDDLIYSEA